MEEEWARDRKNMHAVEYAIGLLMQENLSIQSCYHTFSLANLTHLATFPGDLSNFVVNLVFL